MDSTQPLSVFAFVEKSLTIANHYSKLQYNVFKRIQRWDELFFFNFVRTISDAFIDSFCKEFRDSFPLVF